MTEYESQTAPIPFVIPAGFVRERARLDVDVLAFGATHGWLDEANLRLLIAAAEEAGNALSATDEEHVRALLRDDLYRLDCRRVFEAQRMERQLSESGRLWLYLALDHLHQHREAVADPFEIIDWLYSEFGCPAEIAGLVCWMPPPPGEPYGVQAMERRWDRYLTGARRRYGVQG